MRGIFGLAMLTVLSASCSPEGQTSNRRTSLDAGAQASASTLPTGNPSALATTAAADLPVVAEGEGSGPTTPPNQPNPDEIHLLDISTSGSGCEDGSVASNISPDARAFTLLFDSFVTELTAGAANPGRKDCEVRLHLHYPAGWTVAVAAVDVRGYASLAGAVAQHHFVASVDGQADSAELTTEFGPTFDANWSIHQDVPVESLVFAPCSSDGVLLLKNAVVIQANDPSGEGLFAIDSLDGEFTNKYQLKWQPCTPEPLPPEPVSFHLVQAGPNSVELAWASAGGTTKDFVLVQAAAGHLPATCEGGESLGATLNHEVVALLPATDYEFMICARNAEGGLSEGVTLAVRTQDPPPPVCGRWLTNAREPLDVNDDGFISPIDALLVINYLNTAERRNVVETDQAPPYLDTNGDCNISPLDVLLVINKLNER